MGETSKAGSFDEQRLNSLLADCLDDLDDGRSREIEDIVPDDPAIVEEIKAFLDDLDFVSRVFSACETTSKQIQDQTRELSVAGQPQRASAENQREWPLRGSARYQVERCLGQGGMGAVYLAFDVELDCHVAIKIPSFSQEQSPNLFQRFRREAQALAQLRHPCICRIFDKGEFRGQPYLSMEYVEGCPLNDFINPLDPFPMSDALRIITRLADALSAAHQKKVTHRDLKPANIIVDRELNPVIVDFGLASRDDNIEVSSAGLIVGTLPYMSPRQIHGEMSSTDPECDIHALGVVLYQILTGTLPYQGSNIDELRHAICNTQPTPPSQLRGDIPPELNSLTLQLIQGAENHGFDTMRRVATELKNLSKQHNSPIKHSFYERVFDHKLPSTRVGIDTRDHRHTTTDAEPKASWTRTAKNVFVRYRKSITRAGVAISLLMMAVWGLMVIYPAHPGSENERTPPPQPPQQPPDDVIPKWDKEAAGIKEDNEFREIPVAQQEWKDIVGMAFGPDSRKLFVATTSSIDIYDIALKKRLEPLAKILPEAPKQFIGSLNGNHVAAVWKNRIVIWDLATNEHRSHTIELNPYEQISADFSDAGTEIAALTSNNVVTVWDTISGESQHRIDLQNHRGNALALGIDRHVLSVTTDENRVLSWDRDAAELKVDATAQRIGDIDLVALPPNGITPVLSGTSGVTWPGGEKTPRFGDPSIVAMTFSFNGRFLVTANEVHELQIWDTAKKTVDQRFPFEHKIEGFAVSPDNAFLSAFVRNEGLKLWAMPPHLMLNGDQNGLVASLLHSREYVTAVAVSANGDFIASATAPPELSQKGQVCMWSTHDRSIAATFDVPYPIVSQLQFSPDSLILAARCGDSFSFWNIATKQPNYTADSIDHFNSSRKGDVEDFAFHPTHKLLIVAGSHGCGVFDLRDLTALNDEPAERQRFNSVAVGDGSQLLFLGSKDQGLITRADIDGTGRVTTNWDWSSGQSRVSDMHFADSAQTLLSGGDGNFTTWDLFVSPPVSIASFDKSSSGFHLRSLSSAISPLGHFILLAESAQLNPRLLLFKATDPIPVAVLRGHSAEIRSLAFTKDGRHAISCASDATVRVWRLGLCATYERDAAEWVIAHGGHGALTIAPPAETHVLRAGEQLPNNFSCLRITLNDNETLAARELGQISNLLELRELRLRRTPAVIDGLQYINRLPRLAFLDLIGNRLTDEGVKRVSTFNSVTHLYLNDTDVDDKHIGNLMKLDKLQVLTLSNTAVTDNAIKQLEKLPHLRFLDISATDVSDGAIEFITNYPSLEILDCKDTTITDSAFEILQERIPNLDIRRKRASEVRDRPRK